MRKKFAVFFTGLLTLSLILTGCGDTSSQQKTSDDPIIETDSDNQKTTNDSTTDGNATDGNTADDTQEAGDTKASSTDINELFTDRDFETDYDENSCVKITFSDATVQSMHQPSPSKAQPPPSLAREAICSPAPVRMEW